MAILRGIRLAVLAILVAAMASDAAAVSYYQGIDVSHWQGTINWSQVAASGVSFAFIKASEGVTYSDPMFLTNITSARAAGVLAGAYHYASPSADLADATAEADFFVTKIGAFLKAGYLRPVLDLEEGGGSLGKTALSAWTCRFVDEVESRTGVNTIIYCNTNYATNYLNSTVANKDLWIANWTYDTTKSPGTGVWSDWEFWQWSNQGSVSGISGRVDLDVCPVNPSRYAVPEPPTGWMFALGGTAMALRWIRRRFAAR